MADWNLAASTHAFEQGAFAGGCGASVGIIEEGYMPARGIVAAANFNGRALVPLPDTDFGRD